jgi:hypothetical protein
MLTILHVLLFFFSSRTANPVVRNSIAMHVHHACCRLICRIHVVPEVKLGSQPCCHQSLDGLCPCLPRTRSPLGAEEASYSGEEPCICEASVRYAGSCLYVLPAKLDQNRLHSEVTLPLRQTGQLGVVDLALLAA